jgi:hypothetical protein
MMSLLRLELRRQRPMAVRLASVSILICLLFYAAGKRTAVEMLALVVGSSFGTIMMVPMGIAREKMEGTLEFLCGLPIEPRTIAASRLAAVALLPIPWVIAIGLTSYALPTLGALNPVGVAALSWLALALVGALGTALCTLYDLERLLGVPLLAFVIAVVLVPRLVHALLPRLTRTVVLQLLEQPHAALALSLLLLIAVAITGTLSFAITARGLSEYRVGISLR